MTQTLKPDRPIWPPVPEPIVPPDTANPVVAPPSEIEAVEGGVEGLPSGMAGRQGAGEPARAVAV